MAAPLPLGASSTTHGRTLTSAEMSFMHHLLGATSPLHLNAEYCRDHTPYGAPILAGPIVAALIANQWGEMDLHHRLAAEHGVTTIAGLGMSVRYRDPVRAGDTIYGEFTIQGIRESASRPGHGVLTVGIVARNQDGRSVLEGEMAGLARIF